jgi:hypothetical protein
MSNQFSRRSLMFTGAAGLAAAAVPAKAAQNSFSPEYGECYRRCIELERARAAPEADDDGPFEWSNPVNVAHNAFSAAKQALVRRPVRGLVDIVALLRVQYWHSGHFVRPQSYVDVYEERTLRAVERLADVEPWDVPGWLVRLVDEAEAREAARRAVWQGGREERSRRIRVNIEPGSEYRPEDFEEEAFGNLDWES